MTYVFLLLMIVRVERIDQIRAAHVAATTTRITVHVIIIYIIIIIIY